MSMKRSISAVTVCIIILSSVTCLTVSNPEEGVLAGAAGGAIIGALVGDSPGDTLLGAIIGAAVGGLAGAYIQSYMDRQAAEMRDDIRGAEIDRVGEGIRVWFDVGILFDAGGFELLVSGQRALLGLAVVLNRYPDTDIIIMGNADDWASPGRALALSDRRSRAIGDYLALHNVKPGRFAYRSFSPRGEARGYHYGRRMGLAVVASDALKRTAREHR
jgi:outer membrane protein OmpA-like peptidoglycan-associated protein